MRIPTAVQSAAPPRRTRIAEIAWIALPFAIYLFVLARVWVNVPIWDDYDTVLGLLLGAESLRTPGEWITLLFWQHNEHRIVTLRVAALLLQRAFGEVDFRLLMLLGNLCVLGTFLFIWREFRDRVAAPLLGAAGFLMFQWTYYEAALMGSAALPHLGAVFFSLGCLFFALRRGAAALPLCIAFGLLAACSQANGLLALPIAAAGCLVARSWRRATVLGLCAAVVWALYFRNYTRPGQHPSLLAIFDHPVWAAHLFYIDLGGFIHGTRWSAIAGLALVLVVAWGALKGVWRERPVAALWIVFIVAAGALATIGRAGFGVINASRYAILSTCLLVVVFLWTLSRLRPPGIKTTIVLLLACAAFSFAVSDGVWPELHEFFEVRERMLREAEPASADFRVDRYGGIYYPDLQRGTQLLAASQAQGYYRPPRARVYRPSVVGLATAPATQRIFGHVEQVKVSGSQLTVTGWSDIAAEVPGRVVTVVSSPAFERVTDVYVSSRPDVVFALKEPSAVYSGFTLGLAFGSEADARQAAGHLCVVVEAPGRPATRLTGSAAGECPS